jgi:GNAT superfamily N-acetyltransferase
MGGRRRYRVDVLRAADAAAAVSVLSESFFDYPVMRFVLGQERDYEARLQKLVTFFVMARVHRDELLLGIRDAGNGLCAAALVSYPRAGPSPPRLALLREQTWAQLGAGARARYELFGATTAQFAVNAKHVHLNMIGVRRSDQGKGLGGALLRAVHGVSASDGASVGVTLTTEVESNVPLYEHVGYAVIGSAAVESTFTTWGMYRRNPLPGGSRR